MFFVLGIGTCKYPKHVLVCVVSQKFTRDKLYTQNFEYCRYSVAFSPHKYQYLTILVLLNKPIFNKIGIYGVNEDILQFSIEYNGIFIKRMEV